MAQSEVSSDVLMSNLVCAEAISMVLSRSGSYIKDGSKVAFDSDWNAGFCPCVPFGTVIANRENKANSIAVLCVKGYLLAVVLLSKLMLLFCFRFFCNGSYRTYIRTKENV